MSIHVKREREKEREKERERDLEATRIDQSARVIWNLRKYSYHHTSWRRQSISSMTPPAEPESVDRFVF